MTWSFIQSQTGGTAGSFGKATLALPNQASRQGSLLIAVLCMQDASCTFTPPANVVTNGVTSGWQMVPGQVVTSNGVLQQWYYADNPGGLYGPGNGAVFNCTPAGDFPRGCIMEIDPPVSSAKVILDTFGTVKGEGYGTSVAAATFAGAFNGDCAIFTEAHLFAGGTNLPVGSNYTVPAGYTQANQLRNGTLSAFQTCYNASTTSTGGAAASVQSATGGLNYTGPIVSSGWGAVLGVYRSLTAAPVNIGGAEPTNCISLDPATGTHLMIGGDVEGCWRSCNFGDQWMPANYSLDTVDETSFGDMKHSLLESGVVYACNGKTGGAQSGFIASADGGCTWVTRNGTLNFWCNGTPSPPRPGDSAHNQDTDRTVNQLIAQDPVHNLLYVVTNNKGVMRSGDFGSTWSTIGLSATGFFPRCITINPNNTAEIWVGMWDAGTGQGGVYHSTNANASSPSSVNFTQMSGYQGTVAEMQLLGSGSTGQLYCAGDSSGLYRAPTSPIGTLTKIGNDPSGISIDTTNSIWVTIDGYVDGSGNHTLLAGCSNGIKSPGNANFTNIIRLVYNGTAGPPVVTDLTGPSTIQKNSIPPFGMNWWHFGASWQFWLGGNNSVNPHILIDPSSTGGTVSQLKIYLCNSGGFFRSVNGGATWTLCVNGMPMMAGKTFTIDPTNGNHFVTGGSDFTSLDFNGDPTGNTPSDINITAPGNILTGAHRESHGADIDPIDGRVYVGMNTAYSQTNGGALTWRPNANYANSAWTDTGYSKFFAPANIANAPACIGVYADHDNSGGRFVLAVAQGTGTYRWDGTNWAKVGQSDTAPMPGSAGAVNQMVPIISGTNHAFLYLFDRTQGVYRSSDFGQTWARIWTKTTGSGGFLAFNPNITGQLWVGTDDGLYKLDGAGTGVVGGTGGPVVTNVGQQLPGGDIFNGGTQGISFNPATGALYVMVPPGPAPGPSVTTLYVTFNNGGSFTDATGGDASVASCGVPAFGLGISNTGYLWGANGERFGFYAFLGTAANAASLAGTGTMTASPSATHGAALAGTGTMTANGFSSQRASLLAAVGTATALATFGATRQASAALSGAGFMDAEQAVITSSSIVPQYQSEQLILAADANDWFTWSIAFKSQPLGRTVSALSPDTDLNLSVNAGGSYEVRLAVAWDGPTGAGFLYNWAYPGDATVFMTRWRYASGSLGEKSDLGNSNRSADTNSGSARQVLWAYGNYQGGQTAGTLSFQWAPNQNSNSPVTLLAGSFMMIRRIS